MLFNLAFEHAISMVQENQMGLKLNMTNQLLAFADDLNLLGDNKLVVTTVNNIET
jgi:hypothetical protein